jgi:LysM repeat protein
MVDRFPLEVSVWRRGLLSTLLAGVTALLGFTYSAFAEGPLPNNAGLPLAGRLLIVDPTPPRATTPYTVQPGDSLTLVARRFGVTVEALAAANGIAPTDFLYAGQKLEIPVPPHGSRPRQRATRRGPQPLRAHPGRRLQPERLSILPRRAHRLHPRQAPLSSTR